MVDGREEEVHTESRASSGQDFFRRYASQLVDAEDGVFDQIVRTRSACGDSDDGRPTCQPVSSNDLPFLVQIVVCNLFGRLQLASTPHKVGWHFRFTHFGKVRSIGAVIAAHDEQQVHLFEKQLSQRILPLLRSTANRVEESKIFRSELWAVPFNNGCADSALNLFGFAS